MVGKCLEHTGFYAVINTVEMFTSFSWLCGENQYHVHSCTDRTTKPHQSPSALTSDHLNKPVPLSFCPNNPPLTKSKKEEKRKENTGNIQMEEEKIDITFYFLALLKGPNH